VQVSTAGSQACPTEHLSQIVLVAKSRTLCFIAINCAEAQLAIVNVIIKTAMRYLYIVLLPGITAQSKRYRTIFFFECISNGTNLVYKFLKKEYLTWI
jgi:hypothetical protein